MHDIETSEFQDKALWPAILEALKTHGPRVLEKELLGAPVRGWLSMTTQDGTALHHAARNGDVDVLRLLLQADSDGPPYQELGLNIDDANERGNTALHIAAGIGSLEMVKALIGAGADAHTKNDTGRIPQEVANAEGHRLVSELISVTCEGN